MLTEFPQKYQQKLELVIFFIIRNAVISKTKKISFSVLNVCRFEQAVGVGNKYIYIYTGWTRFTVLLKTLTTMRPFGYELSSKVVVLS